MPSSYSYSRRRSNRRFGRRRNFRDNKPSKTIDTSLYTKSITKTEINQKPQFTFDSVGVSSEVCKILDNRGYVSPTEIQVEVIPKILEEKDVIGISQTGSGKTAAFLIPIVDQHILSPNRTQTLILTPTRELGIQIEKELHKLEIRKYRLFSLLVVGGLSMRYQIKTAKKHNDFIVATPGRLKDLVGKELLDLSKIQHLVLDEMDRMLDMGFIDDIKWIVDKLPKKRQTVCFSATLNPKIKPILEEITNQAEMVTMGKPKPSENVEQNMVRVKNAREKNDLLLEILSEDKSKSIIFINTKKEVERVAFYLKDNGYDVEYIHGDRTQRQRMNAIRYYSRKPAGVLVATDVASRGIDIDDINCVINYDEPKTVDEYIHRIGRTGRAGNFGRATTFVAR